MEGREKEKIYYWTVRGQHVEITEEVYLGILSENERVRRLARNEQRCARTNSLYCLGDCSECKYRMAGMFRELSDKSLQVISSEDADDQLKEVNNIDKQLVSWLTDGVEGLYECVYVMHNFRDCVHVNSLTQENNGRNQYDTALNVKFLKTGNENSGILNPYYLTPSEFTSIETSCAEAEYVVFGLEDTKQDAVAAYGSIFGLRLALDYVSVYMTSELRNIVMETAAAAGPFAPAVYALLPLAFSVPRAGLDMYLIMNSKLTPFMYREMDDWVRPEFKKGGESTSLLVGYGDYLLFMLLTKGNATRTKRVQDVVEMNIAKLDEGFKLDDALVGIYAHSDCSVRYLFMSQSFMPAGIKRDGRYKFSVNTAFTY